MRFPVVRELSTLLLAITWCVTADLPAHAQGPAPSAAAPRLAVPERSAELQRAVDRLVEWVEQRGGEVGAAVLDVASGELFAAARASVAVNPASNAKLLTAAAALARLGPDYRYTTALHGRLRGDRVGDLVLRGHGDPSLGVADLDAMCRSLVGLGLRRVEGRILVDQSRFDAEFVPPAFEQQPDEWAAFRAPVSAVAVERNAVTLNVVATRAGDPARLWFHPPGVVEAAGSVSTREAGNGQAVQLSLRADGARLRADVGGHLAEGLPRLRFSRRLDDPRLAPGHVLAHLLRAYGVQLSGTVALGGQDVEARLVVHGSAPLSVLLYELGKQSDNFYAEMILKTLGAEATGAPARSGDGAEVVAAWLREVGAHDAGTVVRNGSGLFDANRSTPLTLARALRAAYRDPALRAEFVASLAVGGVDGTLRSRFQRQRRTRAIRAKTGTLTRVDALSGYAFRRSGAEPIAFSLVVSQVDDHREVRRRIDHVVEQLLR